MNKPNLCIIRPYKIGDIIITLPIAEQKSKQFNIIWPISSKFFNSFKSLTNYITFIPLDVCDDDLYNTSIKYANDNNMEILDLCFRLPGSTLTSEFDSYPLSFDQFIYNKAGVDFKHKWNLDINRNKDREQDLFNKLVKHNDYVVYSFTGSTNTRHIDLNQLGYFNTIEITQITDNIFDWLTIIERAKAIILIDSCFANLVNQLKLPNKKYFLLRSGPKETPVLTNDWIIL